MASPRPPIGSGAGTSASGQNKKRKNALGSRTDVSWKHGHAVDGDSRKLECKYCKKIYTGGAYRFKHHLACTSNNVEPCVSVPDDVKKEMLTILVKSTERPSQENLSGVGVYGEKDKEVGGSVLTQSQSLIGYAFKKQMATGGSKQATLNQLLKIDLREEASRQIARFFYTSAMPFNCVKNPEFEKMCELIAKHGPRFKPPTFHEHFTKGKDLIRPAVTRFATAYLTLGCLSDNKAPLMTMFSSQQWKSSRFASLEIGKKVEHVVLNNRKVRELADLDNIDSDDEWNTEDDVTREVQEGEDEVFEVQNLEDMRPPASVEDLEIQEDVGDLDDGEPDSSDDDDDDENGAMEE
ncbi:uncharacterized protein G2W53_032805 [Senna tora]|uniref:BED-type domain-containing protein n=1 Tax=Senna tora TaxID=362788 RepID=A0A834T8E9_9FABA|nr:uncharacterized protein G2W53_032805 [Senna tora]